MFWLPSVDAKRDRIAQSDEGDRVVRRQAAIPAIRARTLVLAGSDDLLFTLASSTALAHAIPQARLVVMDGAGHSFPTEFPAEFAGHVLKFLAA